MPGQERKRTPPLSFAFSLRPPQAPSKSPRATAGHCRAHTGGIREYCRTEAKTLSLCLMNGQDNRDAGRQAPPTEYIYPLLNLEERQEDELRRACEGARLDIKTLNGQELSALIQQITLHNAFMGNYFCNTEAVKIALSGPVTDCTSDKETRFYTKTASDWRQILDGIISGKTSPDTPESIMDIHRLLSSDILESDRRGAIRNKSVRIKGTEYRPPVGENTLEDTLGQLIENAEHIEYLPLRAIYLHLNIIALQPFDDGNKRTARAVENVLLLSGGYRPTIALDKYQALFIRKTESWFLDTGDYSQYTDVFTSLRNER